VFLICGAAKADEDADHGSMCSAIKSKVAHELDKTFGVDDSEVEEAARVMTIDLSAFIQVGQSRHVMARLSKIFHEAVKLHVIFMKSKALFKVVPPAELSTRRALEADESDIKTYDLSGLRDENDCEEKMTLFFTPLVLKIGNADGDSERFGISAGICKPRLLLA
jgi:hypothetical protein